MQNKAICHCECKFNENKTPCGPVPRVNPLERTINILLTCESGEELSNSLCRNNSFALGFSRASSRLRVSNMVIHDCVNIL